MTQFKLNHQPAGFTLLEALIAVLIVGIVSTLALPAYTGVLLKARRVEARAALFQVMQQQERFYTEHASYAVFSAPTSLFRWWSGTRPEDSFYELSAQRCPEQSLRQCVLITATPGTELVMSEYLDPECGSLMLDSTNAKTYSGSTRAPALCW